MPLYEYQCDNCDTKFELRRPIRDSDAPTECPNCASEEVTRQVSLFMAFTKGSGDTSARNISGGCGCGGACSCGGHHMN